MEEFVQNMDTTSNISSWRKAFFCIKIHVTSQLRFWWWLVAEQATSHYLYRNDPVICHKTSSGHNGIHQLVRYLGRNIPWELGKYNDYWYPGAFQKHELVILGARKFSFININYTFFQCMDKISCAEFQRKPLKFHTKYLTRACIEKFRRSQIYELVNIFETPLAPCTTRPSAAIVHAEYVE